MEYDVLADASLNNIVNSYYRSKGDKHNVINFTTELRRFQTYLFNYFNYIVIF